MIVAMSVTDDGRVGHTWGKARQVAVAEADGQGINSWTVHEVRWDVAHDEGTHGAHHARVVKFLREHQVDAVVVDHVGEGMSRMLQTMGVRLVTGVHGDAKETVVAVASER